MLYSRKDIDELLKELPRMDENQLRQKVRDLAEELSRLRTDLWRERHLLPNKMRLS